MPARFKLSFPAPREKVAVITVAVDSDTVEEDDPALTVPPTGPDEQSESPSVAINTVSDTSDRQPPVLSYPDVQILPIATSTSGQEDVVHRTASTGVIFTWTEPVNGFAASDVQVTVQSDFDTDTAMLCNFQGVEGSTSYTAQLHFPARQNSGGTVTLRIPTNVATSVATMRDGPIGSRSYTFRYDFARGVIDGTPKVDIQLPARSPYIGRTAPIRFLWNVPVVNFGIADVTFAGAAVTMSAPQRTSNANLWEAELTLPSANTATAVTVTVAEDSVTSLDGVPGPENATADMFTYRYASASLGGAPAGTTVICDTEWEVDAQPYLGSIGITGGAVYGVTDMIKIGDNLFGVCQVRKRREGRTNELSDTQAAGAVLFRVNLDTNACTILKAYPTILEASRSLAEHAGSLYFFEGTGQLYTHGFGPNPVNNPRVGNLGMYSIANQCLTLLGKVWRTQQGRQVEGGFEKYFGIAGGTFSPMLSNAGKLLALPGLGNVSYVNYATNRRYLFQKRSDEPAPPEGLTYNVETNELGNLGDWQLAQPPDDENLFGLFEDTVYVQQIEIDARARPPAVHLEGSVVELDSDDFTAGDAIYGIPTAETGDSIAAVVDNWSLVSYSQEIEPRLALVITNELTPWDFLLDLARMTLTILFFQDGLVFMKPRLPVLASLSTNVTTTSDVLPFRYTSINRPFPASGNVVIGSEVLSYGAVNPTSLGMVERAQSATIATAHSSGAQMVLVNHVLNETAFASPLEEVSIESDATNLYNNIVIRFDAGTRDYRATDSDSITAHGEREFVITVPFLSRHQSEWVRWCAEHTLSAFKELQHIIRMRLHPRFDIEIGDYLFLAVPRDEIRRVGLVTRVLYSDRDEVTVEMRTITF